MEIRIGIQHSPREIVIESEEKADALLERLSGAIADGTPVSLVDDKGRTVLIPGERSPTPRSPPRSLAASASRVSRR